MRIRYSTLVFAASLTVGACKPPAADAPLAAEGSAVTEAPEVGNEPDPVPSATAPSETRCAEIDAVLRRPGRPSDDEVFEAEAFAAELRTADPQEMVGLLEDVRRRGPAAQPAAGDLVALLPDADDNVGRSLLEALAAVDPETLHEAAAAILFDPSRSLGLRYAAAGAVAATGDIGLRRLAELRESVPDANGAFAIQRGFDTGRQYPLAARDILFSADGPCRTAADEPVCRELLRELSVVFPSLVEVDDSQVRVLRAEREILVGGAAAEIWHAAAWPEIEEAPGLVVDSLGKLLMAGFGAELLTPTYYVATSPAVNERQRANLMRGLIARGAALEEIAAYFTEMPVAPEAADIAPLHALAAWFAGVNLDDARVDALADFVAEDRSDLGTLARMVLLRAAPDRAATLPTADGVPDGFEQVAAALAGDNPAALIAAAQRTAWAPVSVEDAISVWARGRASDAADALADADGWEPTALLRVITRLNVDHAGIAARLATWPSDRTPLAEEAAWLVRNGRTDVLTAAVDAGLRSGDPGAARRAVIGARIGDIAPAPDALREALVAPPSGVGRIEFRDSRTLVLIALMRSGEGDLESAAAWLSTLGVDDPGRAQVAQWTALQARDCPAP